MIPYEEVELKVQLLNFATAEGKVVTMFEKDSKGAYVLNLIFFNDKGGSAHLEKGFSPIRKYLDEALRDPKTQQKIIQRLNGMKEWWKV